MKSLLEVGCPASVYAGFPGEAEAFDAFSFLICVRLTDKIQKYPSVRCRFESLDRANLPAIF